VDLASTDLSLAPLPAEVNANRFIAEPGERRATSPAERLVTDVERLIVARTVRMNL
jgi:hypothetical protein